MTSIQIKAKRRELQDFRRTMYIVVVFLSILFTAVVIAANMEGVKL